MKTFPITFNSSADTDLKTDLSSVWEFNETSGTSVYDSHGSYNGTVVGARVNQTGKIDKCYYFDGSNDYVKFGTTIGQFDRYDAFSMSTWFKLSSLPSDGNDIMSKMRRPSPYEGHEVRFAASNQLDFILIGIGTTGKAGKIRLTYTFSTNIWYHILVTYDGTASMADGAEMYLNGDKQTVSVEVDNLLESILNTEIEFNVGNRHNDYAPESPFHGYIDQPAMWERELNSGDASDLYNSGNGLAYLSW